MATEIPLTQNRVAIVDDIDAAFMLSRRWHVTNGYAASYEPLPVKGAGKSQKLLMHRLIADIRPHVHHGFNVFHLNGNRLDNRRQNLVKVHRKEQFRRISARCRSGEIYELAIEGVFYDEQRGKYSASVIQNGIRLVLDDNLTTLKQAQDLIRVVESMSL